MYINTVANSVMLQLYLRHFYNKMFNINWTIYSLRLSALQMKNSGWALVLISLMLTLWWQNLKIIDGHCASEGEKKNVDCTHSPRTCK